MIENNLNNAYDANDIKELTFPDTVREKVGMYLGDGGQSGFVHTLTEILDNSIDEYVAGHGSIIEVNINSDTNKCSVRDYGRGIPFDLNSNNISALVLAMTTLHAGGKHRSKDGKSSYKYSSGINGVGASVVNGVSNSFFVKVIRDNRVATIEWKNGKLFKDLEITENINNEKNGTFVEWTPSVKEDEFDHFNVFESDCKFIKEDIVNMFQYIPYLNIGLEIVLKFDNEVLFFKKQDSSANILQTNNQKTLLENTPIFKEELALISNKTNSSKKVIPLDIWETYSQEEKNKYEIKTSLIELTFNFAMVENPLQLSFANGVRIGGGKPDIAFKQTLKSVVNEYVAMKNKKIIFEQEDIFNNLTFMLSVKINQPSFSGQTKDKLNNPESGVITKYFMEKYLNYWINNLDRDDINLILQVLETCQKARQNSKKIMSESLKSINSLKPSEILKLKGKLEDCWSNEFEKNELFIVEGDSAAGPVRTTRNSKYQAFIPLKGKPLNVIKKTNQYKVFQNSEIKSLSYALGGIGEDFDIDKVKYHKIIILADADLDGYHITSLMLTFFFHFYPEMIKKGYIYVGLAPLYKIITNNKNIIWAWDEEELKEKTKDLKNYNLTRNKGLGEMQAQDLFETTLNPMNRKIIKVTIDDLIESKNKVNTFMSDDKEDKFTLKDIMKKYFLTNQSELSFIRE